MKTLELFAGAGGAALGLKAAGFEHLACIESDQDAAATLKAAGLPSVEGDVRDLDLCIGLFPDILWSSFPCQCWSIAGKRLGAEDETSGDGWAWTRDVIDFTQPRWFIGENVVGLTTHRAECEGGCIGEQGCPASYLDRVILSDLRMSFPWAEARILNSSSFGVPQHRRRLFIVAGPGPIKWPGPTHGKDTGQMDLFGRKLLPWEPMGSALESCEIEEENCEKWDIASSEPWRLDIPSPAVCATEYKGARHMTNATASKTSQRASDALFRATGRRRLTAQECATLQGFPKDHPFQGGKVSQYRQAGNAVPPRLAEAVARAVINKQKELEER